MEQFGIIEVFEEYAESKGWDFVLGLDNYSRSAYSTGDMTDGRLILITDLKATPTHVNGKTTEISYSCLMMLGRKFDADGVAANLAETDMQKYSRRLKMLMQMLDIAVAQIACKNGMEGTPGEIYPSTNQLAENMDFAVANNVTFIQ